MPLQFDTVKSFETAFQTTTFEKKKKTEEKKGQRYVSPGGCSRAGSVAAIWPYRVHAVR